jgi:hypothetical protein
LTDEDCRLRVPPQLETIHAKDQAVVWSKCTSTGNAFQALLRLPIWAFWQSDAGKAVMDDGVEKILLMAVCIFVVCMFGLRNLLN